MSDENDEQEMTDQQAESMPAAVQTQPPPPPPPAPALPQPPSRPTVGPTVTSVLKPRADGTGYDKITRVENRESFPGSEVTGALAMAGASSQHQQQVPARSDDERLFGNLAKRELSAAKYFEECFQNKACAYWKVEVRRQSPVKWPNSKNGKALRQGDLGSIMLDTHPSMRERIIEQFGGGRYMLILKDESGSAHERMFLNISVQEYPPRNPEVPVEDDTADDQNEKAAQSVAEDPGKEDRITELRRKRQEKLEEAELKKVEAQIEKDEKARSGEGSAEISSLREELRESQKEMSQLILTISNQSNETIKALAAKPQDSMMDKLLPILATFMTTSQTEKKEAEENRRRDEERREAQRKEEAEQRRREAEERRKEEAENRRRDEERREAQRKEEAEQRRRDDEKAEARRKEEAEQRRHDEAKADERRREEIQMLANLLTKKEDTTTPIMLKAIQESNQTFLQSLVESNKTAKSELGETSRTQSQFLERIIGVLTETSKADSGKYEKLLDSLIANRLESGSREVENFRNAMELGKAQLREAMQLVEARDDEEEEPPAPAIDPGQSMWSNISNVLLALILSKSGNKDVQQGMAAALGQPANAQLTMSDYQQVAQGMTPMVAQQMGFPMQSVPVAPIALPMVPQQPAMPQQPFIPQPPAPIQAAPVFVPPPAPIPNAPVAIPPVPGTVAMQVPQQAEVPVAQEQAQGPKPLPPAPRLDAQALQRLREQVDEMLDAACGDIGDESREQQWTDYALGYLPKWFLDRMVMMMSVNRADMVINLIRQASSVEKFTRLNALVMNPAKYQIFMQGLMDIVSEHRDDRASEGFVIPAAPPIAPEPPHIPDAPMPASAPPASAIPIPSSIVSPPGAPMPIPMPLGAPIIIPDTPQPPASTV